MPAARKQTPEETAAPASLPYYEATEPLFIHNPESGVAPARAFSPGDHVPPDLVAANGWAGQVRVPAGFAGPLPAPAPAGETLPPRTAPAAAPETASSNEE